MLQLLLVLMLVPFSPHALALPQPLVPDSTTPGSICTEENEDFVEYRYKEEIPYCERNVSGSLKTSIYKYYGIPSACRTNYTIDHFYPLSIGGDNSRENLWPEHKAIKQTRANLETLLYKQISKGEITQAQALEHIRREKMNPDTDEIEDVDSCDSEALSLQILRIRSGMSSGIRSALAE